LGKGGGGRTAKERSISKKDQEGSFGEREKCQREPSPLPHRVEETTPKFYQGRPQTEGESRKNGATVQKKLTPEKGLGPRREKQKRG